MATNNLESNEKTDSYIHNNTPDLFTITSSKNEECFTVQFHSKSVFDFADKLTELYDFKGKKNSAISASTTAEGQKMTLTLYRTQKLLIQGIGAKLWKSTEFQKLSYMFNQYENQNLITDGVNEQTPSRKQPTIVHETPFHEPFHQNTIKIVVVPYLFSANYLDQHQSMALHRTVLMPTVVCMMLAQYLARRRTNNEFQHQRTTKIKCKNSHKEFTYLLIMRSCS